jgi:RAB protein geranylgeranyltransferase component A
LIGELIPSETGDQQYMIFIPPQSIGNSHAIQCVMLDDSVQVAPPGCTLPHLTTTTTTTVDEKSYNDDSILEKACQLVLAAKQTEGSIDEI